MRTLALQWLAAGTILPVAVSPAVAAVKDGKVKLEKVSGSCVSAILPPAPSPVSSQRNDRIKWTLTNDNCPGEPKVKFSAPGTTPLFKDCQKEGGGTVNLTAAPIAVARTVTLECPVDYDAVLGAGHGSGTPPQSRAVFIRDVARSVRECRNDPPDAQESRKAWIEKCRSAELEIEVVP